MLQRTPRCPFTWTGMTICVKSCLGQNCIRQREWTAWHATGKDEITNNSCFLSFLCNYNALWHRSHLTGWTWESGNNQPMTPGVQVPPLIPKKVNTIFGPQWPKKKLFGQCAASQCCVPCMHATNSGIHPWGAIAQQWVSWLCAKASMRSKNNADQKWKMDQCECV